MSDIPATPASTTVSVDVIVLSEDNTAAIFVTLNALLSL